MAKATLSSIVRFKPNLITFLRFIMILASAQFYQADFVLTSAGITMISVILAMSTEWWRGNIASALSSGRGLIGSQI